MYSVLLKSIVFRDSEKNTEHQLSLLPTCCSSFRKKNRHNFNQITSEKSVIVTDE